MTKRNFHNKVVVITGGASGIGLAVAWEFARNGSKIAMLDMDKQALDDCKLSFLKSGYSIFIRQCNVSVENECNDSIKEIHNHFGTIDVLFNNAGITQRGLFENTSSSVFQKVMNVNFYGSLYCTKAALPSLIEQKGLIIVNESIAGVAPLLGRTGYSASKHALHGLFTSLRCELRKNGVHVMIVCPGFVKTNLQTRALGSKGEIAAHPQTKIGKEETPENAAAAIFSAAKKEKDLLILTFTGKLGYWISRIAPSLYEKIMTNKFSEELNY